MMWRVLGLVMTRWAGYLPWSRLGMGEVCRSTSTGKVLAVLFTAQPICSWLLLK